MTLLSPRVGVLCRESPAAGADSSLFQFYDSCAFFYALLRIRVIISHQQE
jgi:hypothetical protein